MVLAVFIALQVKTTCAAEVAPILAQDVDEFEVEWNEDEVPPEVEEAAKAAAALAAVLSTIMIVVGLVMFAVSVLLIVMNYMAASAIPQEYQQTNPALAFLMLVPCVQIVMWFIVLPGLAKSFQAYFNAQGRTDVGDCGSGLALGTAICLLLLGPVGLVLWIILTLKWNGYKAEIQGAT